MKVSISALITTLLYVHAPFSAYAQTLSPAPAPDAPAPAPELEYVGNNGNPAANFPLQACQGDCDNNAECADGLVCFQRSATEEVPGCSGAGRSGWDYCFERPEFMVYLLGSNPKELPLDECTGDW